MAMKIRLARGGSKKRPHYAIVASDSRMPRDGRFIERVGSYNPMVAKDHPDRLNFDQERIKYWLGVGATPSDRVARFLSAVDLVAAPVIHEQTKKHLPKAKAQERLAEAEAKKAAAAEAAAAAAAPTEAELAAEEATAEAPAEAPAEEAAAEAPAEAPAEEEKKEEA